MEGYECWLARSADAALRRLGLELRSPDVILLDLLMPGMSVRRFISHLKDRATWARAPIILMAGTADVTIPADLLVDALLPKPFSQYRAPARTREWVSTAVGQADRSIVASGPTSNR